MSLKEYKQEKLTQLSRMRLLSVEDMVMKDIVKFVPAVRTCPMMTSETSSGFKLALFSTSFMTTAPRSWRGTLLRAPLNEPLDKNANKAKYAYIL